MCTLVYYNFLHLNSQAYVLAIHKTHIVNPRLLLNGFGFCLVLTWIKFLAGLFFVCACMYGMVSTSHDPSLPRYLTPPSWTLCHLSSYFLFLLSRVNLGLDYVFCKSRILTLCLEPFLINPIPARPIVRYPRLPRPS